MWDYDDIDIGKLRNLESEGKFENMLINILCLNSKQDNRCPCRVFIRKNTKLDKISNSGNMTPFGGATLRPLGWLKILLNI